MKTISVIITLLFYLNINQHPILAQASGEISYPSLGIAFTIPDGWVGQEVEGGYLIGHQTHPGFALMMVSDVNSLEELKAEAKKGINESSGTQLNLKGELEQIGSTALGGVFEGTLEFQPVTSYIIGVVNSYGSGVSIITAASPDLYSETHKNLAQELALSLSFSKPETPTAPPPSAATASVNWKERFSNAKLTYMDSYYSSGSSYGGYSTGGGYSTSREIHLCSEGYFRYKSSDYMSVDTGGAFGSSSGGNTGDGSWQITYDSQGNPFLVLKFRTGETYEYSLTYEDKKTYLNGDRYFVTYASSGPDYAPECF
jgi:hypothetical protein